MTGNATFRRAETCFFVLSLGLALSACGPAVGERDEWDSSSSYTNLKERAAAVSEDDAMDIAADNLAGSTYADLGEPYGCTQDCSGHEAGVAWAQENGLVDPSDCGGYSQSFIEGCIAYTEAVQSEAEDLMSGN